MAFHWYFSSILTLSRRNSTEKSQIETHLDIWYLFSSWWVLVDQQDPISGFPFSTKRLTSTSYNVNLTVLLQRKIVWMFTNLLLIAIIFVIVKTWEILHSLLMCKDTPIFKFSFWLLLSLFLNQFKLSWTEKFFFYQKTFSYVCVRELNVHFFSFLFINCFPLHLFITVCGYIYILI